MLVGHIKLGKRTGSSYDPNVTQIWEVTGQVFAISIIFQLYMRLSKKTIYSSDIKLSPMCFPFNSEQYKVPLQCIEGIFVTRIIPEGNSVTLIGKIACGQTGSMALTDIV